MIGQVQGTLSQQAARLRPLAYLEGRAVPASWEALKRVMDVAIAAAVLTASSPVIALAALGIVFASPGSPFFAQERVGREGRRFKLFKLRTMVDGAHLHHDEMRALNDVDGPVLKIRNDPRLHPLGKLLRRTSIDELPNLINVLRGEMSIVGPRPPLPSEVAAPADGQAGDHLPVADLGPFERPLRRVDAFGQRIHRHVVPPVRSGDRRQDRSGRHPR